jgi:hypothetical protein
VLTPYALPYLTSSDAEPKYYWQGSLGSRRGPRGLFPHDAVCCVDDEKVTQQLSNDWFAERKVGFISDGVGPRWEWKEPVRRRSKW